MEGKNETLFTERIRPIEWCYSNYIVAKGSVWKEFLRFYDPIIESYLLWEKEHPQNPNYKNTTSCLPFIFERLFSIFLNSKRDKYKIRNYSKNINPSLYAVTMNEVMGIKIIDCWICKTKDYKDSKINSLVLSKKFLSNSYEISFDDFSDIFYSPSLNTLNRENILNDEIR